MSVRAMVNPTWSPFVESETGTSVFFTDVTEVSTLISALTKANVIGCTPAQGLK